MAGRDGGGARQAMGVGQLAEIPTVVIVAVGEMEPDAAGLEAGDVAVEEGDVRAALMSIEQAGGDAVVVAIQRHAQRPRAARVGEVCFPIIGVRLGGGGSVKVVGIAEEESTTRLGNEGGGGEGALGPGDVRAEEAKTEADGDTATRSPAMCGAGGAFVDLRAGNVGTKEIGPKSYVEVGDNSTAGRSLQDGVGDDGVIVVVGEHACGEGDAALGGLALKGTNLFLCAGENGHKQRGRDADDGHGGEQFDERKGGPSALSCVSNHLSPKLHKKRRSGVLFF